MMADADTSVFAVCGLVCVNVSDCGTFCVGADIMYTPLLNKFEIIIFVSCMWQKFVIIVAVIWSQ